MAFREIIQWDGSAELPLLELHNWRRADRFWLDADWLGRPVGMLGACVLHFILVAIFLQLTPQSDPAAIMDTSTGLKVFDMPAEGKSEEALASDTKQTGRESQTKETPAPATPETEVTPTEWTISRMKVARTSTAQNPPVPAIQGALTSHPTSASAALSGTSGFDPYAGASPRRPGETYAGMASSSGPAQLPRGPVGMTVRTSLDLQSIIIRELKIRYPKLKGRFTLTVKFKHGEVSDILVQHGQLDQSILQWLKSNLGYHRQPALPLNDQISSVNLPEIILT